MGDNDFIQPIKPAEPGAVRCNCIICIHLQPNLTCDLPNMRDIIEIDKYGRCKYMTTGQTYFGGMNE